jgi:DNA invertase Pin-like site-specific DNA recombinase
VFHLLGALDEFQRELIVEGTNEGLAAARARGRTGGRKAKLGNRQVRLARAMYAETDETGKRRHTVADIAAELSISGRRSTASSSQPRPASSTPGARRRRRPPGSWVASVMQEHP